MCGYNSIDLSLNGYFDRVNFNAYFMPSFRRGKALLIQLAPGAGLDEEYPAEKLLRSPGEPGSGAQDAANFSSLMALKSWTPPPTRFVV